MAATRAAGPQGAREPTAGRRVILFGDGQVAALAHFYLTHDSPHEVVAFSVDGDHLKAPEHRGLPVVPFEELVERYPPDGHSMLIATGYARMNRVREAKYQAAKALGYELISYVSSTAIVWPDAVIGDNCFIQEANVIQPFTRIGNNVVMWSGSHLGHESRVGDNCFVSSHVVISGNVTIEANCFLGVNATLRDGITIGRECVIGAGALVTKDTQPRGVYVGAPAQRLQVTSDRLPSL
jgi:sugar O-acyltransferase (sialic acid O-acetyltransferase NeuD family)